MSNRRRSYADVDTVTRALRRYPEHARAEVAIAIEQAVERLQREVIARVPVRTGNLRALLASKQAIGNKGRLRKEFGFRTKRLKAKGYYGAWVEFGTSAYEKGDERIAARFRRRGSDWTPGKKGRPPVGWKQIQPGVWSYDTGTRLRTISTRTINRRIPARPAQPYMRPALQAVMGTIREDIREAVLRAMVLVTRNNVPVPRGSSPAPTDTVTL